MIMNLDKMFNEFKENMVSKVKETENVFNEYNNLKIQLQEQEQNEIMLQVLLNQTQLVKEELQNKLKALENKLSGLNNFSFIKTKVEFENIKSKPFKEICFIQIKSPHIFR